LSSTGEPLPKETREHGQRRLILYLITGGLVGQFTIANAPLFLLALGATPFHIGLLATVFRLASTSRLAGARALPYFGKARTMYLGRLFASVCPLLLIPLALGTGLSVHGIWLAIGLLALRQIIVQAGGAAFWPLVQDNTSGSSLSAFITRQKLTQRAIALGIPLVAGWYLGSHPSTSRFAAPFAMAAIVGAIGALVARGISERSLPTTTQRYAHRIRAVLQFPAIRGFALCFGMCHFAQSACMPFWVIVLRDRGMPVNYYVWLTALTALGEILTLYAWGRIVEVHGYRAVLTASLIPLGLAAPAWLVLPTETTSLIIWGAVFYFLWGVFSAGWNFGETRAMIDAVPEEYQGEGFAVMVFVVSLTGALGAFAGGFAFEWANSLNAGAGGAEPTLIYLVLTQALLLCGWSLCRFLKGFGEQPSLAALMARLGRS